MARKMKPSGIEWIGDIPADWEVKKNKNLFFEIIERSRENEDLDLLSVSEYYGVGLRKEKIEVDEFLTRAETLEGYKKCNKNDLVMNIMLAWKKAIGMSKYDGIVSPAYCVYRTVQDDIYIRYFHYLFRTDLYADTYKRYSSGIIDSRLRLYPDVFLSLYSHCPRPIEQQSIADYLDIKCSQIDNIIEQKQNLIEKLSNYKKSLIYECVTGKREVMAG